MLSTLSAAASLVPWTLVGKIAVAIIEALL
jgi:hypothetical protein